MHGMREFLVLCALATGLAIAFLLSLAFGSTEPMRPGTRFRIASLSKPVGAAVALSMVAPDMPPLIE